MRLFVLHFAGKDADRLVYLQSAARKLKVELLPIDVLTYDFSKPCPSRKGDAVYRLSKSHQLAFAEQYFLQNDVVSFYRDGAIMYGPFVNQRSGLLSPNFVPILSASRDLLRKAVKKLGGFPIVLKVVGGSRGLGVMKVETLSALFSFVDFLIDSHKKILLMEYLPSKFSARVIVVGDRVVGMIEYQNRNDDFRSNEAKSPKVIAKKFPQKIQDMAVAAVKARGLELGGVDLLIHGQKAYIAEVNFPCNFARAQKILKKDIAAEMISHLLAKVKR